MTSMKLQQNRRRFYYPIPTKLRQCLYWEAWRSLPLKDNLALPGQISQGFKAPTVYDLYYFYSRGASPEPNPDLKAERSISYEVGTRGNNAYGNMEFAVFINDYKDFITQTKTGQSGGKDVFSKYNIDEVRIYGAELSSTLLLDTVSPLPHGSYARLAVAYAHGEDKATGKEIDTVAPLTSVFGLGYDQVNFGSALNVKMVASKDGWQQDNNLDVAGYTVVDLTAKYVPVKISRFVLDCLTYLIRNTGTTRIFLEKQEPTRSLLTTNLNQDVTGDFSRLPVLIPRQKPANAGFFLKEHFIQRNLMVMK